MDTFNRQNLKQIRDSIEGALASLGKEYGITIELGNRMTFSTDGATFKTTINGKAAGNTQELEDFERRQFEVEAFLYGLTKEDYGKKFMFQGKVAKLVGINSRRSKMPMVVEMGEKRYKMSSDTVKYYLKMNPVA